MPPTLGGTIPFFDYPRLFADEEEMLLAIVRDVGRRGAFILQADLTRFEEHLAQFLGARHALGVGNATDGLLLALRAAGVRKGDEVIFCSHTMVASAAAIHFSQGVPVPVECGADHLIDPAAVARAITPRTRAILPTQLNGRTADMTALQIIANKNGLVIVEDAAQALGSKFGGRSAGTFGAAAAISFYPAKILGCLGDGGAVITSNSHIRDRLLELRDHGRRADGEIVSWGLNSRLDNLQAAILDARLRKLEAAIDRRRAIARMYRSRLSALEELKLPPGPDGDRDHFDVYQNYEIEALHRDALRTHLKEYGIGTILPWGGKAVHQWDKLGFTEKLPFTEKLFEQMVLLPLNMSLTDGDVNTVCDAIHDFYRR